MAVYILDEDVLDKMAQIEGQKWKEQQEKAPDSDCSFRSFHLAWKEDFESEKNQHLIEEGTRLNYFISVNDSGAIYGYNGYSRYAVRADGRIFFLRDCSTADDIQKATSLGFDIM